MKTAQWGRVGRMHWSGDWYSKTHAFEPYDDSPGMHEYTLCGQDFHAQTDRDALRKGAQGITSTEGAYICDIGDDLSTINCKRCRAAIAKATGDA